MWLKIYKLHEVLMQIITPEPFYNTVRYNTVLDIRTGPQMAI